MVTRLVLQVCKVQRATWMHSGCGDVPLGWVDSRRYLIDKPTPCTD